MGEKRTLRDFFAEHITITREQYFLGYLIGVFCGCGLMFIFSLLGLV